MNKFYVIGSPIKQSKSPNLFNYIFKKLNIDCSYSALEIDSRNKLLSFINKCRKQDVRGLNITMPLKKNIFTLVSQYDLNAKITQAINCIYFKNGELIAYNNDVYGFSKLLEVNNITIKNSNNLIIGSGASARSIILSLINNQANNIYIIARNNISATKIINDMSSYLNKTKLHIFTEKYNLNHCNLINCTPITMLQKTNTDIINRIPQINYNSVIDINYNIQHNYFDLQTNKKINGKSMFVFQALKALDIWFESNISDKLSYKELEKIIC